MKAAVLGLGIVAPGGPGCAAFLQSLSGPPPASLAVTQHADAGDLRSKRLPRLDRMTLGAAREALGDASREKLSVVFGTGYGGLQATVDFLEGVAVRGLNFGSPTAFHQSVHHAPLGQLSIALQIKGACLTTSARELSGESALKMGMDLLASGRAERVLVVAADEVVPTLVAAYRAFGILAEAPGAPGVRAGEGAAAILLGREGPSDLWLESVRVTGHPTSSLRIANAEAMAPALRDAKDLAGSSPRIYPSASGLPTDGEELAALESVWPAGEVVRVDPHLGFNPSGGLLRLVAAALQLRARGEASTALIHSLAPGGGQAVSVLRHGNR